MKKLIIATLLAVSMAAGAGNEKDVQFFISWTSQLSTYCVELIPERTTKNKACEQMFVNVSVLSNVDNKLLKKAILNRKTQAEMGNIINSLGVVYQTESY